MSVTEGLRVGDTVVHSRTMEVKFAKDGYVELHDTVEPTIRIGLHDTHKGSDVIKIVKKAKPQAGDVVTGDDIAAANWKRGAVVRSAGGDYYMLQADGRWACSGSDATFGRQDMSGTWRATIIHLP